jgi:Putative zinc-binding metallo-peptidase
MISRSQTLVTVDSSQSTIAAGKSPDARSDWVDLPDEALLDVRLCDLHVTIADSWLEERLADLHSELDGRGLTFRPHYWLSAEWFSPDGVPGVAIPFYLAHPRLMRLERSQMLEVEGGTPKWCMQILRHEAGHAFDNAYELRRLRKRRRVFGSPATPYPDFYLPRPYSKSFVLHLDSWYAQSHPDEDFAETFAVWLRPDGDWRRRYADWPALRKLEYMDAVMKEIAGKPPRIRTRRQVEPLERLKITLRKHYAQKRSHYGVDYPNFYDRDLARLFSADPEYRNNPKASRVMHQIRRDVRRLVAEWTGSYQYTIDRVIEDMIARANEMNLRLRYPLDRTKLDFTMLLTVQTMNYLHSGRHRVAL